MDRVAMRNKVISANVQEFVSLNKALYKCKKKKREQEIDPGTT